MTTAVCVRGFLLLVFIAGAHTDYYAAFGSAGGRVVLEPFRNQQWDHCSALYRVISKRYLLLVNCCLRDTPAPEGYNVECTGYHRKDFVMSNLTASQSGDYWAVQGRGDTSVEETRFRLTVCAERGKPSFEKLVYDEDAVLCRMDPALHETSLQLYRYPMGVLLLDTGSSLEPLENHLRGRLQVDLNNSQVTLSEVTQMDSGPGNDAHYYCVTWKGARCQSYSQTRLIAIPIKVFGHEEESVTFPCILKGGAPSAMYWFTPNGEVRLSSNNRSGQYMLNGSQTGDYSLIIPSVSPQHFGIYVCRGGRQARHLIKYSNLYICTTVSSLDVMFSHGESVILEHSVDLIASFNGVQWYRQRVLQPQVLILQFRRYHNKSVVMPEDLRDRVTVSSFHSNYSLAISNLTEEDSGVYMWRVYGHTEGPFLSAEVCYEGTITLKIIPKKVFAHEGENVSLSCLRKGEFPSAMLWSTPNGHIRLSSTERGQYMLNGSQTGDYSLIIPSVSLQHSGGYECKRHHLIKSFHLYVCTKVSPLDVMFSHGESVILEYSADLNGSWSVEGVQWYRQKVLQPQVLILELNRYNNKSVLMPEDLRDRVSSLHPNYSLTISNLTEEDSGVYMWRVFGRNPEENDVGVCYEGRIHLRETQTNQL